MPATNARLAVFLTEDIAERVRVRAAAESISTSAFIRHCIETILAAQVPFDGHRMTNSLMFAHYALDELLRASTTAERRKAVHDRHRDFMDKLRGPRGDGTILEAAE